VIRTNRTIRTLRSTSILPAAILVGICADLLFYGKSLGISLLLFVLLFVGTLAFVARRSGVQAVRPNLWLLAPLFFFAGMVAVRDNAFVTALNVLAVATLSAYLLHYYAAGRVGEMGLTTAVILPAYTAARSLLTAVPIVTEAIDAPQVLRGNRSNLMPIVRGGLLAMPLLFVFTLLLASADLIFANQIVNLFSAINISRIFSLFFQGLFILAISWAMTGGLALALDGKDNAAALDHRFTRLRRFRFLGFTESTTLLSLVNLLFLSFVIVQFRYLFGGESNVNQSGYSYAEYARRGFFELLVVAALSLGVVLGLEALTRRESKQQIKSFNFLSSFMIVMVVIMLASAFRRMRLYEGAFGYTELRLYVYVFMIWLGVFFLWFLAGLWRRPDRFALGAIIAVMGFLVTLNLLNPDAFIVRQNVARYWAGGDLDVPYLASLSADAVPVLVAAIADASGPDWEVSRPPCQPRTGLASQKACKTEMVRLVQRGLKVRFQNMQGDPDWRPWHSFQHSQWRAFSLLSGIFA
jgi:hypothetical protein